MPPPRERLGRIAFTKFQTRFNGDGNIGHPPETRWLRILHRGRTALSSERPEGDGPLVDSTPAVSPGEQTRRNVG